MSKPDTKPRLLGYVAVDTSIPFTAEHFNLLQQLEGLRQKGALTDPAQIVQWQQLYVMYQNAKKEDKTEKKDEVTKKEVKSEKPTKAENKVEPVQGVEKKVATKPVEKKEDGPFTIFINGVQYQPTVTDINMSLLTYIRSVTANVKGTKKGCYEGGCGACTVMLTNTDGSMASVNSCLRPLLACNGMHVTTIEGIGGEKKGFHPIQERLAEFDGTQCGFCSPGFVMNMYSFLSQNPNATKDEIEKQLDGNICRCTGYRPILDAFKSFASDSQTHACSSSNTSNGGSSCGGVCGKKNSSSCNNSCKLNKFYADIEEIPTPKLPAYNHVIPHNKTVPRITPKITNGTTQWLTPPDLATLYHLMATLSPTDYSLVFGHTSWGIYKDWNPNTFISIQNIDEFTGYNIRSDSVAFGSCTTISTFLWLLQQFNNSSEFTADQKLVFPELIYMVSRVANAHVRNAGSIGGNIMLANLHSFQSDLCIALMGIGASVWIGVPSYVNGVIQIAEEVVPLEQFVTMDMTKKVVRSIIVPLGTPGLVYKTYKVSHRNVNAKSVVNAGMSAVVNNNTVTAQPFISFGNIRTKQVRMANTEKFLVGKVLSNQIFSQAATILRQELQTDPTIPDSEYRTGVAMSFFYKFYLSLLPVVPPNLQSAVARFERGVSSGEQSYQSDPSEFPVSAPIHKLKGKQQCSGEAQYTADISPPSNALHASFVLTPMANADIVSINASTALGMEGVVAFISAADIPGSNTTLGGYPIFASKRADYAGQAVGVIVATTQAFADRASKEVIVNCANQTKPILTIADAVSANSFFNVPITPVQSGNIQQGLSESDYVIKGTVKNGGQCHFHIETQTCVAIPDEDGNFRLNAATQDTSSVVANVSSALNISRNKVAVSVRRCGGGYGGKLNNSMVAACASAIAANKLGAPVSLVMELETNMKMLGMRPEISSDYTVGVMKDGTLKALQIDTTINAGCAPGDSLFTSMALLATTYGPYNCPNFYSGVKLAKTNIASTTSVRGPGWTPATFCIEHIMEHVAAYLKMPSLDLKIKNFFQKGQTSPDGTKLLYWNLDTITSQLRTTSDYDKRLQDVQTYNANNKWTKKGLAFVPLRWAAGWQGSRLSSMVTILSDGSVMAGHGGVEIGQGIDTKVAQTIAYKLGIPFESVSITTHTTTEVPEVSGTGGSVTSELCCAAAIDACTQLNARLQPIREKLGNPTWQQLIQAAYQQGTNLQAIGFVFPGPGPNSPVAQYQSYSAVVQEVFVDILTGEHQLVRADILFDAGVGLNPLIDIGQVEGAYVMGVGLFSTEQISYDPTSGNLLNFNTWTYKPPSYADIPIDFRVNLLKNAPNPVGVLSAKVVGEPPVALACAAVIGVQLAVAAAKQENGQDTTNFGFNAPAIPENVFLNSGLFNQ